jgi:hypothetical protein
VVDPQTRRRDRQPYSIARGEIIYITGVAFGGNLTDAQQGDAIAGLEPSRCPGKATPACERTVCGGILNPRRRERGDACNERRTMRLIMIVLLMTFTAPARAEWVKIAESTLRALYYNPAAINTKGSLRRVWSLQDNKQPGNKGELSSRYLSEFDCTGKRQRLLSFSAHAEPMGRGETIEQRHDATGTPDGAWRNITPDTFPAHLLELVCQSPRQRRR